MLIEVWVPKFIRTYAGFLVTYFGRGIWLTFLGAMVLGPPDTTDVELFFFVSGVVIMGIGLLIVLLHFVRLIGRPKPLIAPKPVFLREANDDEAWSTQMHPSEQQI